MQQEPDTQEPEEDVVIDADKPVEKPKTPAESTADESDDEQK